MFIEYVDRGVFWTISVEMAPCTILQTEENWYSFHIKMEPQFRELVWLKCSQNSLLQPTDHVQPIHDRLKLKRQVHDSFIPSPSNFFVIIVSAPLHTEKISANYTIQCIYETCIYHSFSSYLIFCDVCSMEYKRQRMICFT